MTLKLDVKELQIELAKLSAEVKNTPLAAKVEQIQDMVFAIHEKTEDYIQLWYALLDVHPTAQEMVDVDEPDNDGE